MIVQNIKKSFEDRFPALTIRNYQLFWGGQLVSLIGTWMQNIGQAWLVLELTNSAFKLGVVNALQFLPMTLFSLFIGPFVDRFPKRKLIIFTQSCLMLLALILATLTYFEVIRYWHILLLALGLGFVNTLDMPARQSFVIELVGKKSLMNAIALNSAVFNLGRVVGPAVAGVLIGALGIAVCFYLNAISFCAVLIGLFFINVPNYVPEREKKDLLAEVKEGLFYIKGTKMILFPLILLAVISTFTMNFNVLVPAFAKGGLDQDALGYGLLMTSMGIGSLLGALTLAANSQKGPRLKVLFGAPLSLSLFMSVLGFQSNYYLACLIMFIVGFSAITFTASVNSTVQLNSDNAMRGRVMSVYSWVFGGMMPLGSVFAGQITELLGASWGVTTCGLIGLGAVVIIFKLFKGAKK
ncbi:MAG TPA: MFS transporter [Peptococcaceae bacterium]|nr:MFS transporter [Peptococcaceae bacterium]